MLEDACVVLGDKITSRVQRTAVDDANLELIKLVCGGHIDMLLALSLLGDVATYYCEEPDCPLEAGAELCDGVVEALESAVPALPVLKIKRCLTHVDVHAQPVSPQQSAVELCLDAFRRALETTTKALDECGCEVHCMST